METNRKFLLNLLILVTLFSCAPVPQILFFRRESVNTDVPESKRLSDSTLQIVSNGRDVGTGFFVARDKIATNIHVVAENYYEHGLAKEAFGQRDAAKVDLKKAKKLEPDVGK